LFGKWLRSTSLKQIQGPTPVALEASVVSPNEVVSPMTGLRVAALKWSFFVRSAREEFDERPEDHPLVRVFKSLIDPRNDSASADDIYTPVGDGRLGDLLMLEADGKLIQIELKNAELRFPGAREQGTLVDGSLPPAFAHLLKHPALRRGPLVYRELALSHGDPVILIATVERSARDGVGPYRSTTQADFSARGDLETAVIEDRMALRRPF
jgi:hypothetical protein